MQSPVFNSSNKSKMVKNQSGWTTTGQPNSLISRDQKQSNDQNRKLSMIYAYLMLQKNCKKINSTCRKIFLKHKRQAFITILHFKKNRQSEKTQQISLNYIPINKKRRQSEKNVSNVSNPEKQWNNTKLICANEVRRKLQKLCNVINLNIIKWSYLSFIKVLTVNSFMGQDEKYSKHNYELQNNNSKVINSNAGRLSNKRKNTKIGKERQDLKQNSHNNHSDLSLENQRLRNQILNQEYESQSFIEKMTELLDHHQKIVMHGSSTTRPKKNK